MLNQCNLDFVSGLEILVRLRGVRKCLSISCLISRLYLITNAVMSNLVHIS